MLTIDDGNRLSFGAVGNGLFSLQDSFTARRYRLNLVYEHWPGTRYSVVALKGYPERSFYPSWITP